MATPPPNAQQQPPPPSPPGAGPGGPGPQIQMQFGPPGPGGQRPTPEQIQAVQRKIAEDAQKAGMTVPQFIETLKKQAQERAVQMRMAQQQAQQQGGQPGAHQHPHPHQHGGQPPQNRQPITPGPPKPAALALATFLKGQDLKPRTCILNGERKDMFKGT